MYKAGVSSAACPVWLAASVGLFVIHQQHQRHDPSAAGSRAAGEPGGLRHSTSYGEPQWLDVGHCQGIQRHHCDLSSLTSDPREWYYARVHASSLPSSKSAWALSPRFSPRWDTKISPPVLRLNVTEEGVVIRVKPPKPLVRKMHSSLQYKIYLMHTGGEEKVFDLDCCSKKLALKELNHQAKYCLQGQTMIPLQAKSSTRGSVKCITTL
ncbi:hypothetical protein L3Q82_011978 [Scortum barcoo]|uniref:Uncharacterized protein n=1 Tax=Scortum barcoo TaxID=214431 RepID=A0ACB8W989_9TELE|nr:hypothetical protein L3Q82_011978 [Scortum barcoo]